MCHRFDSDSSHQGLFWLFIMLLRRISRSSRKIAFFFAIQLLFVLCETTSYSQESNKENRFTSQGSGKKKSAESSSQDSNKPKLFEFVEGSAYAPVTITIYESYTCPHCIQYAIGTHARIEKEYIATNKVRIITRNIPMDKVGYKASLVVYCMNKLSGEKDAMSLRKTFFANMPALMSSAYLETKGRQEPEVSVFYNSFLTFAELGGVSRTAMNACVESDEAQNVVLETKVYAVNKAGVNVIPIAFVNKERLDGGREFDEWKIIIDRELAMVSDGSRQTMVDTTSGFDRK